MLLQDDMNAENRPSIILPLLKVLKLSLVTPPYGDRQISDQIDVAVKLILSRVKNGHPIVLLDMRKKLPLGAHPNLEALAEESLRFGSSIPLHICHV